MLKRSFILKTIGVVSIAAAIGFAPVTASAQPSDVTATKVSLKKKVDAKSYDAGVYIGKAGSTYKTQKAFKAKGFKFVKVKSGNSPSWYSVWGVSPEGDKFYAKIDRDSGKIISSQKTPWLYRYGSKR